MPELPEVETIVRGLRKNFLDQKIKTVTLNYPRMFKGDIQDLRNDKFSKVERHGKYIKLTTKKGLRLIVHLRMTGQFFITDKKYRPDKHVHIILGLADGKRLIYRDIRKFGTWIIVPPKKQFEDYINAGVDALGISLAELKQLMASSPQKKLKAFLLDQTILAGVGNIYADEICFGLGVDPETPVRKSDPKKLQKTMLAVLQLAIKHKGTSVSDYLTSTGARGNFQNLLKVYKQKKCPKCGGSIIRKKVAGRTSHVCPICQK